MMRVMNHAGRGLAAALLLATPACADRMTAAEPARPQPSSHVTELLRAQPTVRGAVSPAGARIRICSFAHMVPEHPPLWVVNGHKVSHNDIHAVPITPGQIAEIRILKGAEAMALYGAEAVNGVVLITLKP
jgi:TonB-dependent SusC/RagA subfamily outer membrane receptor